MEAELVFVKMNYYLYLFNLFIYLLEFFSLSLFIFLSHHIPYSAYISRVFNFANFVSLESFVKLIQLIF